MILIYILLKVARVECMWNWTYMKSTFWLLNVEKSFVKPIWIDAIKYELLPTITNFKNSKSFRGKDKTREKQLLLLVLQQLASFAINFPASKLTHWVISVGKHVRSERVNFVKIRCDCLHAGYDEQAVFMGLPIVQCNI